MNKYISRKNMSFLAYLIDIALLYMILLLYYKSKNFSLFGFHLVIIGVDIIGAIDEDIGLCWSSKGGYATAIASYATAAYMNYIIVLVIIRRIASSFINSRNLIDWSYMTSFTDVSDVLRIIIEVIKLAEDLNRINIFSIDSGSC